MRPFWFASLVIALLAVPSLGASQSLTFAADDYPSFRGARAIVAADFDRNGWLDLAHANTGRNSVTILLNHPDSGLSQAFDIPVGAGPFDLATADFNRDGKADLAVANADGNSISILLGAGSGSLSRTDIPAASQGPRGNHRRRCEQ